MFKDLIQLLFPASCYACGYRLNDNEKGICTTCRHNLPVTNFHNIKENAVTKTFYGRVKLEHATSLFWFHKKGLIQHLLHNLKYKGHEEIGQILGQWLGYELKNSPFYSRIDVVIPVPLHKSKLRKRGYNQVTKFGKEIACALDAKFMDTILLKTTNTSTQVFKSRFARWDSKTEIFSTSDTSYINNKHVLLVDDIITTGATIESCAEALINNQSHQKFKLSVASMAIAQ